MLYFPSILRLASQKTQLYWVFFCLSLLQLVSIHRRWFAKLEAQVFLPNAKYGRGSRRQRFSHKFFRLIGWYQSTAICLSSRRFQLRPTGILLGNE